MEKHKKKKESKENLFKIDSEKKKKETFWNVIKS